MIVFFSCIDGGNFAHLIPGLLAHELHGIANGTIWLLLIRHRAVACLIVEVTFILLYLRRRPEILQPVRIVTALVIIHCLHCFSWRFHAREARLYHIHLLVSPRDRATPVAHDLRQTQIRHQLLIIQVRIASPASLVTFEIERELADSLLVLQGKSTLADVNILDGLVRAESALELATL